MKLCDINTAHRCSCLDISLPVSTLLRAIQKTTKDKRLQKRQLWKRSLAKDKICFQTAYSHVISLLIQQLLRETYGVIFCFFCHAVFLFMINQRVSAGVW